MVRITTEPETAIDNILVRGATNARRLTETNSNVHERTIY